MKKTGKWAGLAVTAALALGFLWALESRRPFYFLQDDNRTVALPSVVHIARTLVSAGQLQQYNFHQYLGYPVLHSSAALYPPVYAAASLSTLGFGHYYAAMDVLVALHLLAAAAGVFLLFESFGLGALSCVFGALSWAFCPFVVYAGASWWVASLAAAYFPWMLLLALRLLRHPSLKAALSLAVLHALFILAGYPQYFAYAFALELLTVLFFAAAQDSCPASHWRAHHAWRAQAAAARAAFGRIASANKKAIFYYCVSCAAAALMALPYILPLLAALKDSPDRAAAMRFAEFSSHNLSVLRWAGGLFWPWTVRESEGLGALVFPELAHTGYALLLLAGYGAYLLWRGKAVGKLKTLLAAAAWGWLFCWLWAVGAFNPFEYVLPVFNRFRWHFKILLFADFYLVMLAALALAWLGHKRPRLAAALAAIQLLNLLALYLWGPARPFSYHSDAVPFSEPLAAQLREGRIYTAGFDSREPESVRTLGYDYATLWRLFHFGGYDVLVPRVNLEKTFGAARECSSPRAPSSGELAYLRKWGVRWYVFASPLRPGFQNFARKAGLRLVSEGQGRAVFEDRAALPLAWRVEKGGAVSSLEYDVRGNSWSVATGDSSAGCLMLNTVYNPGFYARPDGATAGPTDDGQTEVCYPAGTATAVLVYRSPYLGVGVWLSVAGLVFLFGILLLPSVKKFGGRP